MATDGTGQTEVLCTFGRCVHNTNGICKASRLLMTVVRVSGGPFVTELMPVCDSCMVVDA